jgi:Tfp pilus assembly protein PilF
MNKYRIFSALLFALLIAAGWESAHRGMSGYYTHLAAVTRSDQPLRAALAHDPGNPKVHEIQGLMLHEQGAYEAATSEFDQAIRLRTRDYRMWIYRGRARSALGDLTGAESDFRASIGLAPHYSEPQNELGRILLRMNRTNEGFEYLSRAASIDETRLPELLELARQLYRDDSAAILRAVNPSSKRARLETALYLIIHDMDSDALVTFVADSLDEDGALKVVRLLIERKRFRAAFSIWRTRFHPDTSPDDASNLIIDGDFESFSGENLGGFGWQAGHVPPKTSVAVNSEHGLADSRCLEIRFNNEQETGEFIVDQLVPVSPGTRYQLSFVSSSEGLVSAALPVVSVIDAETRHLIAESRPLGLGAALWQQGEIDFTSSPRTTGIVVGVRRGRCESSPCPIFGQLRLDNFVLTSRNQE